MTTIVDQIYIAKFDIELSRIEKILQFNNNWQNIDTDRIERNRIALSS